MAHKVGSDLDGWCTKCRIDTPHVIVSLKADNETPKRAECKSCGGQHNYRLPKTGPDAKKKKAAKKKAAKKKTTRKKSSRKAKQVYEPTADEWGDRTAALLATGVEAKPYSIRGMFEANELVDHKKFGQGVVITVLIDNKVKILFRDGLKTLIMGRT